jgi:DNA polymerase-3 subunit gamma/tau
MATQALYRRYRPRRFSEVKGQDHVVRALRNAVINHREGQAYLFSGPRGTGKTTSARILAKVLNCERPVDGEPCCECASCVAVEAGTSYDVFELDAASNNGVDAIRDLIDKASLGSPGRHRVYILDEVHMLSKGAEAALLKTLEEPPPHVVFVLATTDPHKVSATIRSRTQHLEFHLLPIDVLEEHIKWLAADAGIEVTPDELDAVLRQGGGSARDTVSALELVASGGGSALSEVPFDELVEAFIERDPGRALAVVAMASQQGLDPRSVADEALRLLRDCFLSLMAPELVQLPQQRAEQVAQLGSRLGAAGTVRAMERLGEMLVDMRHASDARVLLEVALVQLTSDAAAHDVDALAARLERLEQQVAQQAAAPKVAPAPADPATGRAVVGGRALRDATPPSGTARPSAAPPAAPATAPAAAVAPSAVEPAAAAPAPEPHVASAPSVGGGAAVAAAWSADIVPSLKPLVRAIYSATKLVAHDEASITVGAPNDTHRAKCEQHREAVEQAAARVAGGPVRIEVVVDRHGSDDSTSPVASVTALRPSSSPVADEADEVDLDDLTDVPPEDVVSPIERLAQAFPGSELLDERS